MNPALLALLLTTSPPLEGATVTAVRLDLPPEDQKRFAPFLELQAGDALSRERITTKVFRSREGAEKWLIEVAP